MIAGDHDGANAGALGTRHGLFGFLARRINHADQAQEDEFLLEIRIYFVVFKRVRGQFARGDAQRAQRLAGEFFAQLQDVRPPLVGQRFLLFTHEFPRTASDQHTWRAFGENEQALLPLGIRVNRRHQLAL